MSTKVALIFPGQGAQSVGMGKEFYETFPQAKAIFAAADKIIPGLIDVIFNGPPEKLTSTQYCQPAIFTFSVAALKALESHPKFKNITPSFACGLSLGEYSALTACGALSFEETLKLVERRSFYMEEATKLKKGAMAAVIGFNKDKLVELCRQTGAEVANFNSPDQIVITGEAERVAKASEAIQAAGAKRVIALDVSGAFHSSLMRPAVAKFEAELQKCALKTPRFSILSNVDAKPETDPEKIRRNLALQITSSVQWVDSVRSIAAAGVTTFLETGPGTVLKGLIRKIDPALIVHNIRAPQDIEALPL
ncbi:MAG TPA: [acyl-carrier-protein] S-malonyltransferase [Candidatus Omnitrophica bacterium]|nr:MAG: [acyl-carrier-protein] S-malonyltransferase [Omnitrophica WOR_2 bacterium GWA2_53_43]HCI44063.1 [acyl-carrier-protein] S-malonyltransferase [Candidatus Omnitrophota bacterium]